MSIKLEWIDVDEVSSRAILGENTIWVKQKYQEPRWLSMIIPAGGWWMQTEVILRSREEAKWWVEQLIESLQVRGDVDESSSQLSTPKTEQDHSKGSP